jgi:hypothetical protein
VALTMVYTAQDEFIALAIRDMLADEGISSMLHSNEMPAYGGITFGGGPWGEVLVEGEDAERATELISGFLGTLGELSEEEEGEEEANT